MKSIDKRLKRLESVLQTECSKCDCLPCECSQIYPEEKEDKVSFQSKVAMLQHKAKVERIEKEMNLIHEHFRSGLENLKNMFEIVDYTIHYVEANTKKVSLLLDAPVTSLFKKELAISFLDAIEPWTEDLIDFLVAKNYPKKNKKKLLK